MPLGRLAFYCESEFKINNYWAAPFAYQTVFYINFEFARSTFEVFKEVQQQADNTNDVTFEAVTETVSFDVLFVPPMLSTLFAIPLHDKIELTVTSGGPTYELTNVSILDTGGPDSKIAKQTISAEMRVLSASDCADEGYVKTAC